MIEKDALEEGHLGDLIREMNRNGQVGTVDWMKLEDAADRREREWRKLYDSMRQQRNNALATLAILNGGDFEKDFEEMKRIAEGRNG